VSRAQLLVDEDRFSQDAVAEAIRKHGREAKAFGSADEIAEHYASSAKPGDLVIVMSNGSFDGLCSKLLEKLKSLSGARR
jgi:UDP-N-acetylmuramate: L-alanyl-gamma-D-glutamyl-meso-diaminopimelate ligase